MASVAMKVCKQCCQPMGLSDDHDMYDCSVCAALEPGPRDLRRSLLSVATRLGAFPSNWKERLYPGLVVAQSEVETQEVPVVAVATVDMPGPSISVEPRPPLAKVSKPSSSSESSVVQVAAKKVARKRPASVVSSGLSAEEAADPVLQGILQNYRDQKMSVGSVSVHSLDSQGEPKPKKKAVRKRKTAQTQPKVPESQVASVSQATAPVPDFTTLLAAVVPEAPVPPVPLGPVPPSPPKASVEGRLASLERYMETMAQSILDVKSSIESVSAKVGQQPSVSLPPATPMPLVSTPPPQVPHLPQPSLSLPSELGRPTRREDQSDDEAPYSQAEFVTLKAKRHMWLSALKDIVPDLPHPPVVEPGLSACLVGLSRRQQDIAAPLLPEVIQGIAERSKSVKPSASRRTPFKWVHKTVTCGQQADRSLFEQRSVPRRLAAEVPSSALDNPGTSGIDVKLKKSTKEGASDAAARVSFSQASTYIRLANSQELAIHGLRTLLDKLTLRLDLALGDKQLPSHLQRLILSIQDTVNTSQLAVSQLQTGNLNFSRCAIDQYIQAVRDRLQAWLAASSLPEALRKQLASMELAAPLVQDEPISILGQKAEDLLEEYAKNRKEDAYRMMLFGKSSQAQSRPAKQKSASQSSFAQSSAKFHPPASQQGRGRGQNRGRGQSHYRGRGKGRASAAKGSASAQKP